MLSSLHIENMAVIKRADMDLSPGFNVLTGETGAGKSILVDAIGFLLGGRGSKDMIRSGETKATVSALFTALDKPLSRMPESVEAEPDEDGCLYLTRTIDLDGKTQTRCGGKTIPVSMQKELASCLISIHGQNDNRILMSPAAQLAYLDSYAGNAALLAEYRIHYDKMEDCRRRIAALDRDEREKERTVDLLRFQLGEIDAASLKPGEEEELTARRGKVKNAEKIVRQAGRVAGALYRSDKTLPAYEQIRRAIAALNSIADFIPNAAEYVEKLTAMTYELEDIGLTVADLAETGYDDPEAELDRIETRLDLIGKLERKYGADVGEILAFRERAAAELSEIELSDEKTEEYKRKLAEAEKKARVLAEKITESRKKAAAALENGIVEELAYLDMPKVRFRVLIRRSTDDAGLPKFNRQGTDEVEFQLSANVGEPLKPLSRIASGGELARIMLALKSVNAADTEGETLIFDEIDTGVSGKTSQKIGIRLRRLAEHNQVICVTHSAQIASEAHEQLLIRKEEKDGRVETTIRPLDREGRIRELARIMGGVTITEKLLDSAAEMLDAAGQYGEKQINERTE